jgi:hypothetical protein
MLHPLIPERACGPLVALAAQMDFRRPLELEILDTKIGNFLHPTARVVQKPDSAPGSASPAEVRTQEEQQHAVAQREMAL